MMKLERKMVYDIRPTVARAEDPVVMALAAQRAKKMSDRAAAKRTKIFTILTTIFSALLLESVVLDFAMTYGII